MASGVETKHGIEVETGLGKIKNVPFKELGWVILALAFAWMIYNQTGTQSKSLAAIAEELPKQTIIMEQQGRTLEKILDKH